MKKLIGLLLLVPFMSLGAVEPIIIHLSITNWSSGDGSYVISGDNSYTVPQGKVLVIESLVSESAGYPAYINLISGGYTNTVALPSDLRRSYKVPSGTTLEARLDWSRAVLFCVLVDDKDLRSLYRLRDSD